MLLLYSLIDIEVNSLNARVFAAQYCDLNAQSVQVSGADTLPVKLDGPMCRVQMKELVTRVEQETMLIGAIIDRFSYIYFHRSNLRSFADFGRSTFVSTRSAVLAHLEVRKCAA